MSKLNYSKSFNVGDVKRIGQRRLDATNKNETVNGDRSAAVKFRKTKKNYEPKVSAELRKSLSLDGQQFFSGEPSGTMNRDFYSNWNVKHGSVVSELNKKLNASSVGNHDFLLSNLF